MKGTWYNLISQLLPLMSKIYIFYGLQKQSNYVIMLCSLCGLKISIWGSWRVFVDREINLFVTASRYFWLIFLKNNSEVAVVIVSGEFRINKIELFLRSTTCLHTFHTSHIFPHMNTLWLFFHNMMSSKKSSVSSSNESRLLWKV